RCYWRPSPSCWVRPLTSVSRSGWHRRSRTRPDERNGASIAWRSLVTYTVLIVDDSKLARMSMARVLGTLYPTWKRIEAADATEALQQTRELSPDVALVDFNMPGKDGVTLAAELRALHPKICVAVIS